MSATVTTTTSTRRHGEAAQERLLDMPVVARGDSDQEEEVDPSGEFMTSNNGVTGREPNTNPRDWPTDHRRVPAHRPPQVHPLWVDISGPAPLRAFLWTMFNGCDLLRWVYQYPTMFGLHNRGYFMYKIAGEW